MPHDRQDKRRRSLEKMKGFTGISMGVFYIAIAVLVVYFEKAGRIHIGSTFSYLVSALMAAYGAFRIYRGAQQIKS